MNAYTYDHELITMSTMFINSMSDIIIKRFNAHKQPRDQIKTRVVYAPKQRVLNDLLDKDQNIKLPVISVYIGGIAKDEGRVYNKILGTYHTPANSTSSINEGSPLPIDITYNVSIMTRYQEDMDQILSHLLPYINPYFTVSWRTPRRPDHEIRSNVFWSGNVNVQYPIDATATQVARVVADLTFTFKGWMFKSQMKTENIFTFNTSFHNIPAEFNLKSFSRENSVEEDLIVYYGAPPRPSYIEPPHANPGVIQQFNAWGTGFEKITNVYLSGSPLQQFSTLQNPFSSVPKLSADYPAFMGVKLLSSEWAYNGDSFMTFVMPSANSAGFVDLIVENKGGYGLLTKNVRVNTFNPYSPENAMHDIFVPYQMPYLSGIQVIL